MLMLGQVEVGLDPPPLESDKSHHSLMEGQIEERMQGRMKGLKKGQKEKMKKRV